MNNDFTNNENDTTPRSAGERPLGYWLRTVDALLTKEFAALFADEGITRRDWMVLNALSGDIDAPGLAARLARKGKRLSALAERGWITPQGDGTWALTDEGRTAKERLAGLVGDLRSRVAGAVPPEDYATMVASLEAIARELGWDEQTWAEGGRGFGRGRRGRRARFGGFGPGSGRGFGPGFRHGLPPAFGPGHAHGWHENGCHGAHAHAHEHGAHAHRHGSHDAEHAYERGFDAGYARGREERIG